jgi:gamma-glutamyltranspeptidase/glutathione hydrolase
VLQRLIDEGLAPQEAVDRPRFSLREDFSVALEPQCGADVATQLGRRGHRILASDWVTMFGGAHVILREDGWYWPASDPRRDGASWGA